VRPYLEKTLPLHPKKKKNAGEVAQGEGPEFKPQYRKKKKEDSPHGVLLASIVHPFLPGWQWDSAEEWLSGQDPGCASSKQ
jgi:hypothetical protein